MLGLTRQKILIPVQAAGLDAYAGVCTGIKIFCLVKPFNANLVPGKFFAVAGQFLPHEVGEQIADFRCAQESRVGQHLLEVRLYQFVAGFKVNTVHRLGPDGVWLLQAD